MPTDHMSALEVTCFSWPVGEGSDSGEEYSRLRVREQDKNWSGRENQTNISQAHARRGGEKSTTYVPVFPDRIRDLSMSCEVPKSESIARGLPSVSQNGRKYASHHCSQEERTSDGPRPMSGARSRASGRGAGSTCRATATSGKRQTPNSKPND